MDYFIHNCKFELVFGFKEDEEAKVFSRKFTELVKDELKMGTGFN